VQEIFEKHDGEESKGIKVHFRLDESGILRLDKVKKNCFLNQQNYHHEFIYKF